MEKSSNSKLDIKLHDSLLLNDLLSGDKISNLFLLRYLKVSKILIIKQSLGRRSISGIIKE